MTAIFTVGRAHKLPLQKVAWVAIAVVPLVETTPTLPPSIGASDQAFDVTGNQGIGCNDHSQTVWLDSRCCDLKRPISSRYKLGQPLAITMIPIEGGSRGARRSFGRCQAVGLELNIDCVPVYRR